MFLAWHLRQFLCLLLSFNHFVRYYFHLSISNLLLVHQISLCLNKFFDQLSKAEENRLPESNCQEHEKGGVHNQTADIEDLLFDFDKRRQLIIVRQHAEGAINPTHHSGLSRFSLHQSQLNNVEDILSDEDTD